MGIVTNLFSRKGSKEKPAVATMPARPAAPNLIMLMPDASGIASYQLHTFVAASEAEAYLVSILRGDVQEGTIMFWALTWMPTSDGSQEVEAEPVVLIRDPSRPGLVYTFSFVDLDSAYDFVRHEVKTGLDLSLTAIFWAVPAEATANHWGEITVTPSNPPTREPATNGDEPLAAPTPLAAPDHDEPNGTQTHIEETPAVRLPELDSDGPQATDEPETVNESEAASEPQAAEEAAHKAIDDADISNVIDILQAKGLRAPSSSPQPTDEPELPEDATHTADEPSDTGNGFAHAGQETVHIDLNDVFGGRCDPETLTTLSDFRRNGEAPAANGLDAGPEGVTEAPDETASGIVTAWSNIGAAIDRAIDAHVARRVSATIAWRRLTTAFAAAASIRLLITWRAIAQALYAGAAIQAARERGLATAWRNIARSFRQAAESKSGRRAVRLAWASISWTLEEAVYAARLQQKKALQQAWSTASSAIAVAALKQNAIDRGIRTAWHRLAVASLDAAQAQEAHCAGLAFAWTSIGRCLAEAAEATLRHERSVFAWANTAIALNEYTMAKLHHDGLVAAWTRLAAAIEEAAGATARHNGLTRAWRVLALEMHVVAGMHVRRDAAVSAWANASEALSVGAATKVHHDGMVAAWQAVSSALHDFADMQMRRNGALSAWHSLTLAFAEAALADLKQKKLIRAWRNIARACLNAVQASLVRQMTYRQLWLRLTTALAEAGVLSQRRDVAVAAWDAIAVAIAAAQQIRRSEIVAIHAWSNATLALNEATVAEAHLRIAQAGLDSKTMQGVTAAIRKATGREVASAASEAAEPAVKETVADRATAATPEAIDDGLTAEETAAAIESWRFRESGRFTGKNSPFESFDSPPGRF
ncbi:MAG: hypothetical protein IIC86_02205 [Chloroflexi bacterium]|nr:hypothetical protein [Chloroflexota bacterium]